MQGVRAMEPTAGATLSQPEWDTIAMGSNITILLFIAAVSWLQLNYPWGHVCAE